MQYLFDNHQHTVEPTKHGNAKKADATPYIRTKESTISRLGEVTSSATPKPAYHKVLREKRWYTKRILCKRSSGKQRSGEVCQTYEPSTVDQRWQFSGFAHPMHKATIKSGRKTVYQRSDRCSRIEMLPRIRLATFESCHLLLWPKVLYSTGGWSHLQSGPF